jgi:hypothetical protein
LPELGGKAEFFLPENKLPLLAKSDAAQAD